MEALPEKLVNKHRGPRSSVSAEAFGIWNKKADFVPVVVQKTEEVKAALRKKLEMAFMFSALDEKDKAVVIDAMTEVKVDTDQLVIKQGDQGDCLFIVDSGNLACSKIFSGKTEPTHLRMYTTGEAFGELSLLYNAPRAATITAKEPCTLWKLDRETFNHIVKDAACRKREKYESFLEKVTVFCTMEPYERSKLADAFKEQRFQPGDKIIEEGQPGNDLFLLQEGEAYATKTLNISEEPKVVMEYKAGDYFGERALIKNEPRAANVIAKTPCVLVSMDRHSVKRLLGPLEELLKRNFDVYEKYAMK